MRYISFIFITAFIVTSCATYTSLDLNRLKTGMTKAQVQNLAGLPNRILSVNESKDGYQEVLEYRTSRGEIYALEFWDDYLTGYEFMYDDVEYIPHPYPPTVLPPFGRPLYVYPGGVYRPDYYRPPVNNNRPNYQNRPNNSGSTQRPDTQTRPSRTPSNNSDSGSTNSNTRTGTERSNRTN